MKCRSCGFNNMRRAKRCARCDAVLVWEAAIDKKAFQPLRGERSSMRQRMESRWNRLFLWFSTAAAGESSWFKCLEIFRRIPRASRHAMLFSVVPGMGHLYRRQVFRATSFFVIWGIAFFLLVHPLAKRFPHPKLADFFQAISLCSLVAAMVVHFIAVTDAARLGDFCIQKWEFRLISAAVAVTICILYSGVRMFL